MGYRNCGGVATKLRRDVGPVCPIRGEEHSDMSPEDTVRKYFVATEGPTICERTGNSGAANDDARM